MKDSLTATICAAIIGLGGVVWSAPAPKTPLDIDFKLAAERRYELDGVLPLSPDAFWPGAQYVATVTGYPAALKFVTVGGEEMFRYELKAGDARLPAVPFDLALIVAGNSKVSVFTRKDGKVKFLTLAEPRKGCDLRTERFTRELRFRTEGAAGKAQVALTAGIGQADIRFVQEGRENRPYVENGRFFFTFSSRAWGSVQGVMSIDPLKPADLRLEGVIFFDYGDGLVRNDISSDLFHDTEAGEWRAYCCNFSTGVGSSGTGHRAPGGVNIARCAKNPLHGVNVMKVTLLNLANMNEDPDGIWDAQAGKWRLLLSQFHKGIKASLWESEKWDGPFTCIAGPVAHDSTGTTIFPMNGRNYILSGSSERACYVYSYPELKTLGKLKFDTPPWPTTGKGGPHGRVWPAVAEFRKDGRPAYLMVTMDRINFPGIPTPNWTYGKLMIYVGTCPDGVARLPLASPLLVAGSGRAALVSTDGQVAWQARGCGNITQVCLRGDWVYYSNGDLWRVNVLTGARELVYRPCPRDGLYGYDILANGNIVVAENGTDDIVELAAGTTNAVVRFKGNPRLPNGRMPKPHHHYRLVHKTAAGTYLVCCSGANTVREYDAQGRLVWEQTAPRLASGHPPVAFDALRRANGNTLIAHQGGVTEYTPDHRAVWGIVRADFPELRLDNLCGLQEMPNGNLVVGSYANGRPDGSRVTAFEVTRDKRIVWAYAPKDDRNMMTAVRIDPAAWPKAR